MALSDASGLSEVVSMLASNDAALIPVIEVNGHDAIPLWRLVAERAVCINTTAAGGNASLLMLHE
jgi:RHH-type proline utilization regulon transcriptional repressor/proline dehydrogenase/delta 1-pyrroline-5-carboxylate dehydrogenase